MDALFDTSVLVASMVEGHPRHAAALPWLTRAKQGRLGFYAAAHSVAECCAVLTALPVQPRITPGEARRMVHDNVQSCAHIVTLSAADYAGVVADSADLGIAGGGIYDALIAWAARKAKVDRLLTFNVADFRRVWPQGESIIAAP